MYRLEYKASFKKELRIINKKDRQKLVAKLLLLAKNPRPVGSAKLKGSTNIFRLRHGQYRVIYQVHDRRLVLTIIRVGHRRDIYKNL